MQQSKKVLKLTHIFMQQVDNFEDVVEEIFSLVDNAAFTAKSLANGSVRVDLNTAEDFHKL